MKWQEFSVIPEMGVTTTSTLLLRRAGVEALKIPAGLSVLRIDGERAFEVVAGLRRFSCLCVEDAEVAPTVGISLIDVERGLLLGDGGREIAAGREQLREQGMTGGICGIGGDG